MSDVSDSSEEVMVLVTFPWDDLRAKKAEPK